MCPPSNYRPTRYSFTGSEIFGLIIFALGFVKLCELGFKLILWLIKTLS